MPGKSRYCPEVVFEFSQGLASLATLPSRFVITGLSHVLLSILVSLFSTTGETIL